MADVVLGADLDMRDVAKAFGTMPDMAAKESKKAAAEVSKAFREAKKAARDAAREQAAGAKAAAAAQREAARATREAAAASKAQMDAFKAGVATFAAFGAAAVGAAKAAFDLANASSQMVDEFALLTASTGLSTGTLLAMGQAAARSGGDLSTATTALKGFVGLAQDAATGSVEAADKFARLGVAVQNSDGTLRDMDRVLPEVLDAIKALPSETERAAAAVDVFGSRGASLAAALGDGSVALDAARAETAGFAAALEDAKESSAAMDASMAALNLQLDTAKVKLGSELTPAVTDAITVFGFLVEKSDDLEASLGSLKGAFGSLKESAIVAAGPLGSLVALIESAAATLGIAADAIEETEEAQKAANEAVQDAAEVGDQAVRIEEKRTTSTKKATEAKKEQAAAEREAEAVVRDQAAALEAIEKAAHKAQLAQLDGIDQVIAKRDDELAKIDEMLAMTDGSAEAFAAAETLRAAANQEANDAILTSTLETSELILADIESNKEAQLAADAATIASAKAMRDDRLDAFSAVLAASQKVVSAVGDLQNQELQAQIDNTKKGSAARKELLLKQFEQEKGLALVHAAINTAMGVTAALGAAAPPVNFVLAGLTAAAGAITIGTISSKQAPTFHTGGTRFAPDEVSATVLRNESVLTRTGTASAGGPEAVRRMNRGEAQAPVMVQMRYKHRVFNTFVEDNLRLSGSPLSKAIGGARGRRGIK